MTHMIQAQKARLCDFCQDPVYNICRECGDGLCKICTANHFVLKPSQVHDIVPYKYGKGSRIFNQCACLSTEKPAFYCFDCYTPFCDACERAHRLHNSGCISENINVLVEMLQEQNLELINIIIPHYQSKTDAVRLKISELPGRYDNIKQRMETHRTSLHKAIDEIFNRELNKLREIEISHRAGLLKQLEKIIKQTDLIERVIARNYDILSDAKLLFEANVFELFTPITNAPLKIEEHSTPEFVVNVENTHEKFKDVVGSLVEKGTVVSSYTPTLHQTFCLKPMTSPKQISLLSCDMYVGDIACERSGTAWVCGLASRHIVQYDLKEGKTKNSISATTQPSFVALNRLGHLFYTEFRDSSVKYVTHTTPQSFAKTKGWQPRGIICTDHGDVLVSEYSANLKHSRIARYNSCGCLVKVIECNESQKPLFQDIMFICQNRNGDIGVTDRVKSVAIIVRQNGQKRFEYSGHIRSCDFSDFGLSGISTDSRCNYVISDAHNNTLHVIDWQGKFLFYVMPGKIVAPMAICVDEKDRVWVAEARGTIRVLTYID